MSSSYPLALSGSDVLYIVSIPGMTIALPAVLPPASKSPEIEEWFNKTLQRETENVLLEGMST